MMTVRGCMRPTETAIRALGVAVLLAACVAAAEKEPQTMPEPQAGKTEFDIERVRQLRQRMRDGEKITPAEQQYLEQATRQIQAHREKMLARRPIGMIPLTDMKDGKYKGEDGGLYGQGSNVPPPAHLAAARKELARIQPLNAKGEPAADGKIVLISIGMSNTHMEFSRSMALAENDPDKSPHVVLVDCAQGSMGAPAWLNPRRKHRKTNMNTWEYTAKALADAGVSPAQVQVAWMKQVKANPSDDGEFPAHARLLAGQLGRIIVLAKEHFPNLRVMYLSSRIYAGYATKPLHPEPYAYETAFSVRWLIQDQIAGSKALNYNPQRGKVVAPLLLWGPYLWADGAKGRKIDDLIYRRDDLTDKDGTHPSESGCEKVAKLLVTFFKTDPLAKGWFCKPAATKPARGQGRGSG